ncbi:histone H2B-like [Carcharodon carcharias]|uniref:histone H2B-like n=1 Tax=Carcharodon carcharias TaxID=13397 RepID=UPI001B7E71DB|nr:histone H2B-like [Carcharodon carcharias]
MDNVWENSGKKLSRKESYSLCPQSADTGPSSKIVSCANPLFASEISEHIMNGAPTWPITKSSAAPERSKPPIHLLLLPGELAKHCTLKETKAVTKQTGSKLKLQTENKQNTGLQSGL